MFLWFKLLKKIFVFNPALLDLGLSDQAGFFFKRSKKKKVYVFEKKLVDMEVKNRNMPGGDRTGPLGLGPRTGRAAGLCAGYGVPGYLNPVPGFGRGFFGRGWGRGRGFRWRTFYPFPLGYGDVYPRFSREDERNYLENYVKDLEEELQNVKKRLSDLSKEKKETL